MGERLSTAPRSPPQASAGPDTSHQQTLQASLLSWAALCKCRQEAQSILGPGNPVPALPPDSQSYVQPNSSTSTAAFSFSTDQRKPQFCPWTLQPATSPSPPICGQSCLSPVLPHGTLKSSPTQAWQLWAPGNTVSVNPSPVASCLPGTLLLDSCLTHLMGETRVRSRDLSLKPPTLCGSGGLPDHSGMNTAAQKRQGEKIRF